MSHADGKLALPQVGEPESPHDVGRREFLKATALLATATAVEAGCQQDAIDAFLQKNLRELTRAELRALLERLERDYAAKFGTKVDVYATPAQEGVLFGYGLDLSRCIGCRRCVHACVAENNQSRPSEEGEHNNPIQWIRVLEMDEDRGVDLAHSDPYYDAATVPRPGKAYIPVSCQQCENPACVKVCPVEATWKEPDGIIVIDYEWCIGCRYCMVACPYGARRFNWSEPNLPKEELNPATHVLGNRPRPQGVVEKCTFCIQRTRNGRYPACSEVCPVGARKFGNLLDPKSEIRYIMANKRVFVLKEELNTQPKFFYFYAT